MEMLVAAVLIGIVIGMAASLPVFALIDHWQERKGRVCIKEETSEGRR